MSKKRTKANEQETPKTKYDRKMEARRKEAARQKRESQIFRIIGIAIIVAFIGTIGYFSVKHIMDIKAATKDPYITVGEHTLTQLEYDYYFNNTVNSYINTYSYFLSYMGLDTTQPYDQQDYSEDMTWQEYFEQITLEQIRQEYALLDDAKANAFEYDTTEDYNTFVTTAKDTAKENQITMPVYYKSMFGDYATEKNVKPFMENGYIAKAYYDKLIEDNTPAEDVVSDYYDEHKAEYDKVSFYSFSFDPSTYTESDSDTTDNTDTTDEADTSEDTDATDEADTSEDTDTTDEADTSEDTGSSEQSQARNLADTMLERLEKGEDFETLCMEYAPEDQKSNYEPTDSEYSLSENITISGTNTDFMDWLADENRKKDDMTVIENPDTGICYVLKFVTRTYDETCLDTISSKLASDAVTEYLDALLDGTYGVEDVKGEISYLKEDSEDTSEDTESSEATSSDRLIDSPEME